MANNDIAALVETVAAKGLLRSIVRGPLDRSMPYERHADDPAPGGFSLIDCTTRRWSAAA